MLPLYLSYFAGGLGKEQKHKTFFRALAFTAGFTLLFSLMGLFAGTIGSFLKKYQIALNIIGGIFVIVFGLSYLEVFRLPFLKGMQSQKQITGVFSAFVFGMIYSVSLTPCIGAFLGSALMLASTGGSAVKGLTLLIAYSLGLGLPFLISALLLEKLSAAFGFIKSHYKVINLICGCFLILIGILMATGLMNRLLSLFT